MIRRETEQDAHVLSHDALGAVFHTLSSAELSVVLGFNETLHSIMNLALMWANTQKYRNIYVVKVISLTICP